MSRLPTRWHGLFTAKMLLEVVFVLILVLILWTIKLQVRKTAPTEKSSCSDVGTERRNFLLLQPRGRLPPGPFRLPILGNMLALAKKGKAGQYVLRQFSFCFKSC